MDKDLIVIGAGPGGYVAAIRAAQLGARVALIEKENLGGTCLNVGCIPTKSLFRSAQIASYVDHAEDFGIVTKDVSVNMEQVQKRKNNVVQTLVKGVNGLLKANNIEVFKGKGKLIGSNEVEITQPDGIKKTLSSKNILIATGSKSSIPPIKGIETAGILSSKEALELKEIPSRLLIVGGGVIGIELAGIFKAFGSAVTVVEFLPTILPMMDQEVTKSLEKILTKDGIHILTNSKVLEISRNKNSNQVKIEQKEGVTSCDFDKVIVCTGREMEISGLGLDEIGVAYSKKGIIVDEDYQTNIPSIYAIGDVTGRVMLAHVASSEGIAAVSKMFGAKATADYDLIPNSVFTIPELSSIGLTEEEAKAREIDYKISKFTFSGNGKALTMGESEGFIKIISTKDNETILGVHILGPHASDLIHEAAVAMKGMFTLEEITSVMHGHPTLPEAFLEAVEGALGHSIHMPPSKKLH